MTDQEICYRALLTRDRRFDGRFFTAVKTTGIYCRPICPARTPLRKNIEFYPSAWAAEKAGYRPCLRCRPESAPGSSEWIGSEAVVSRALRLIEDGRLEEQGLHHLAASVGIGERQLRRLFQEHLGAAPIVVAQTRRVQLAKQLIDHTDLTLAQVAFAAGFSSVRRFNDLFSRTYGRAPSTFRRRQGAESGRFSLSLGYRPPYSWESVVDYLTPLLFRGCETFQGGVYRRLQRLQEGFAEIAVAPGDHAFRLTMPVSALPWLMKLRTRARRMFDLDADPMVIAPRLTGLNFDLGRLRVPGAWDPFESAVRTVLGQQVSVKGAATLGARLVERFGERVAEGELTHLFPLPSTLAEAPLEEIGLIGARARTVRRLAQAVQDGLPLDAFHGPELEASLISLPGVGPWTASMVALHLGDPDAFPSGDLVLRRRLGGVTAIQAERLSEIWRPFRSYATMALWQNIGEER